MLKEIPSINKHFPGIPCEHSTVLCGEFQEVELAQLSEAVMPTLNTHRTVGTPLSVGSIKCSRNLERAGIGWSTWPPMTKLLCGQRLSLYSPFIHLHPTSSFSSGPLPQLSPEMMPSLDTVSTLIKKSIPVGQHFLTSHLVKTQKLNYMWLLPPGCVQVSLLPFGSRPSALTAQGCTQGHTLRLSGGTWTYFKGPRGTAPAAETPRKGFSAAWRVAPASEGKWGQHPSSLHSSAIMGWPHTSPLKPGHMWDWKEGAAEMEGSWKSPEWRKLRSNLEVGLEHRPSLWTPCL